MKDRMDVEPQDQWMEQSTNGVWQRFVNMKQHF